MLVHSGPDTLPEYRAMLYEGILSLSLAFDVVESAEFL